MILLQIEKADSLLNNGVLGVFCFLLLSAVVVLWRMQVASKEEQMKLLKQQVETYREMNFQLLRDMHETMDDVKKAVEGFTDMAIGFRELVNVMIEYLNKKSPT